jgi:hypothetical protein
MQRQHFPWILIGILALGAFGGGVLGFVIAAVGMFIVYLVTLRVHPRIRHTGWQGCAGTGEHRGAVFTWTHRKCPGCNGGRLIRRGAGIWGAEHIRHEYARSKAARETARSNGTWR